MSPTQFAYQCLNSPPCPPLPKHAPPGTHGSLCWLCGSTVTSDAWSRSIFPDTFTNVNLARAPLSPVVCPACVYLSTGDGWKHHAARFPDLGVKTVHPLSWRSYSHLFVHGEHRVPNRADLRDILLAPPEPPFLLCIALSGQKHLLFRSAVAHDRDQFPVQFEEASLWIDRESFTRCLLDTESSLSAGLTRDEITTGRYRVPKPTVDRQHWRQVVAVLDRWRRTQPAWLSLAVHVAQREDVTKETE